MIISNTYATNFDKVFVQTLITQHLKNKNLKTFLRYTLERRLGQGNFADVWKAHHRLGSNNKLTVAIKVIDKTQRSESDLTKIYREIEILKKLRHPHIIRLYQVFESGNYIFLGMYQPKTNRYN